MPKYLVIIGDLIESRTIQNRDQIQQQIKQIFASINQDYQKMLVSRLTLTLGDEFQLITRPQSGLFQMLDDLERRLRQPFRMGIGYGDISTQINPELSIGADGEAFWNARDAINHIHDKDWNQKNRVRLQGFGQLNDELLNSLLAVSDAMKLQWTDLQRFTFEKMLEAEIYSDIFEQKPFAASLSISESSLTKRLNAGNIKLYIHARKSIEKAMEAWA